MALNDAVDWSADLGGGVGVALIQAGTFRSDAGALFGPVPWVLWGNLVADEVDDKRRLLQALNCLLVDTPSGRVLVETGIGERVDDKTQAIRSYEGPAIAARARDGRVPARDRRHRGDEPSPFRPCRRPSAGGRGTRVPARADRRPEGGVAGGARRQPEARGLVRAAGTGPGRGLGRPGLGRRREGAHAGVSVVPTGGHSTGHQAVIVRGSGDGARTVAFFGDLCMRPWAANPRWVTSFDDFPLDWSPRRPCSSHRQPTRAGWSCSRTRSSTRSAGWSATATGSGSRRCSSRSTGLLRSATVPGKPSGTEGTEGTMGPTWSRASRRAPAGSPRSA